MVLELSGPHKLRYRTPKLPHESPVDSANAKFTRSRPLFNPKLQDKKS